MTIKQVNWLFESDPGAGFYKSLQQRYGLSFPVLDADVRVVITVRPTGYVAVESGMTEREREALKRQLQGSAISS